MIISLLPDVRVNIRDSTLPVEESRSGVTFPCYCSWGRPRAPCRKRRLYTWSGVSSDVYTEICEGICNLSNRMKTVRRDSYFF